MAYRSAVQQGECRLQGEHVPLVTDCVTEIHVSFSTFAMSPYNLHVPLLLLTLAVHTILLFSFSIGNHFFLPLTNLCFDLFRFPYLDPLRNTIRSVRLQVEAAYEFADVSQPSRL